MKKEIILSAISYILDWYAVSGRHTLPWRNLSKFSLSEKTYRVWLSEILLQQTQVARVIPFYENILLHFPTIYDLAKASYEDFFPYYQGMGYYSRARNMLRTAEIIAREYDGIFPSAREKLLKLPGIGKYTSEAIRAFAYDIPTLAWDTNLEKIFSRILHGSRFISLHEGEKKEIENIIFTSGNIPASTINSALMDWSNCVDFNKKELILWQQYIPYGVFASTHGSHEEKIKKRPENFPLPDACIIVILHRDHREYFMNPEFLTPEFSLPEELLQKLPSYNPFLLPPSFSRDIRKVVQDFFRERYTLEVSVRPVHKKGYNQDFFPYCIVNAQIQSGVQNFLIFQK